MRLYFHYCSFGFSNCYILGNSGSDGEGGSDGINEAIIIDPGSIDEKIVKHIEDRRYVLRAVLITHGDLNHSHGLRTLKKIYDTEIYSINPVIREFKTNTVQDGETISIGSFKVETISVPGHSADSAVFKIERLLFTGDALSAGLVGRTANIYAEANQMAALQSKILSLQGDYTILPGHGPPSTLGAERRFNADIHSFKDRMTRRKFFRMEI